MMRYTELKHQFVIKFPDRLESGVLYVSIEYATAAHLCCCGCGVEVVTPLTPTDWTMTFDGETISLWPSIGNWNEKCRSHYVIERSRVISAMPWSERRINIEWERERAAKASHYANETPATLAHPEAEPPAQQLAPLQKRWRRVKNWFGKWRF